MKITVIGGGGIRTVSFINGLLGRYKKLGIDQVVLYDIDQPKLKIIAKLCSYIVKKAGESLIVKDMDSIIDALTGADYIVTTLRVGGDHARVIDEATALNRGVLGQETTGAGGFSMACRSVGALLGYCELAKIHAPNALMFNFTNPSGLVTQTLYDAGFDNIIGICDAPSSTKSRMAGQLDVTEDRLYTEFFGLNHLSWIRSVKIDQKEILPDLLQDRSFLNSVQEFAMFDPESFDLTGFLPNEYLYYYYHREKAVENILKASKTRGQVIEEVNTQMFAELAQMDIDASPEEALQTFLYYIYMREYSYMAIETGGTSEREIIKGHLQVPSGMGYAGVMLDCIEGLQSDKAKDIVLSIPNKGAINGLRPQDVVEITCRVSKAGIQPVMIESMPQHCYSLIQQLKNYENAASAAIREKSEKKAIEALTLHPLIMSFSLAKELIHDYIDAYGSLF